MVISWLLTFYLQPTAAAQLHGAPGPVLVHATEPPGLAAVHTGALTDPSRSPSRSAGSASLFAALVRALRRLHAAFPRFYTLYAGSLPSAAMVAAARAAVQA